MSEQKKSSRISPEIPRISIEQADALITLLKASKINPENSELIQKIILKYALLAKKLESGQLTMARLRKLFKIQGKERSDTDV
jgi:transposase